MTGITNGVREHRRAFLRRALTAGGALGAAFAFGSAPARERVGRIEPKARAPLGYRETEHVRQYYEKAAL